MINLKIKTLDSQDHDFSVDDDITVRQFKEHIAEKTRIAADMQRLIYCGRVLNDEKLLREYDVNGKVVHLVERAPPRARNPGDSSRSESSGNFDSNRRIQDHDHDYRTPPYLRPIEGMVMGSMAIPMNTSTGTSQAITHTMNPSSTLCMNRITVARHMLDCANNIINFLENPERGLNNSDLDILAQQTMESTVFEVGISAVSDGDVPQQDVQNFVQAFQGAVSAAFRQNGLTNIEITPASDLNELTNRMPTVVIGGGLPVSVLNNIAANAGNNINITGTAPSSGTTAASSSSSSSSSSSTTAASATTTATNNTTGTDSSTTSSTTGRSAPDGEASSSSNNASATSSPSRSRNQTTSPTVLAEVVQQMRTLQIRIEPFLEQYYEILQNEPTFAENDTAGRENSQRIFNRMSEALHYMSHAQHAISDLMLDLSQPAPRHLCCRPILVEQSAYVSSGFAVPQGMIQLPRRLANANLAAAVAAAAGNNNESSATNHNSSSAATAAVAAASGGSSSNSAPSAAASASIADAAAVVSSFMRSQEAVAALAAGRYPVTPSAPPASSAATNESNVANAAAAGGGQGGERDPAAAVAAVAVAAAAAAVAARDNANNANGPADNHQMHVAHLIQAVVNSVPLIADGYIEIGGRGGAAASTNASTTGEQQTTTSELSSASTTGSTARTTSTASTGESPTRGNDQPRVTTATHPTTSTQTRSTARPQVHVTSLPPGIRNFRPVHTSMQLSSFDRFLPCNSHHVRENQENQRPPLTVLHRRTPLRASVALDPRTHQHNYSQPAVNNELRSLSFEELSSPIRLFGIQLPIRDLIHIAPNPNALNRIRADLQAYVIEQFGSPISRQNMFESFNRISQILNDSVLARTQSDQSSYNAVNSVNNLIQHTLPVVVDLILEDVSSDFAMRLLRAILVFMRRLMMILVLCVGRVNAQQFLNDMTELGINTENDSESNAIAAFKRHIRAAVVRYFDEQTIDRQDVQEFLVIRLPVPTVTPPEEVIPMETDDETPVTASVVPSPIVDEEILPSPPSVTMAEATPPPPPLNNGNQDPLPHVLVGSESWHSGLPTTWLPVIARDISRQRRINTQAPFSDAYLTGMSSKRRKLITANKPTSAATDPRQILNECVRSVIQSRTGPSTGGGISGGGGGGGGGSSSAGSTAASTNTINTQAASITEAITTHPHIHEPYGSYEQAIRTIVQSRINTDPDYNAERFQNCSKWINKKK